MCRSGCRLGLNFDLWPRRHLLLGRPKDVPASPHHRGIFPEDVELVWRHVFDNFFVMQAQLPV